MSLWTNKSRKNTFSGSVCLIIQCVLRLSLAYKTKILKLISDFDPSHSAAHLLWCFSLMSRCRKVQTPWNYPARFLDKHILPAKTIQERSSKNNNQSHFTFWMMFSCWCPRHTKWMLFLNNWASLCSQNIFPAGEWSVKVLFSKLVLQWFHLVLERKPTLIFNFSLEQYCLNMDFRFAINYENQKIKIKQWLLQSVSQRISCTLCYTSTTPLVFNICTHPFLKVQTYSS